MDSNKGDNNKIIILVIKNNIMATLLDAGKKRDIDMVEVARSRTHIFWKGMEDDKVVYNITPIGSYKPSGGYFNKYWILGAKGQRIDLFN